MKQYFRFIVLVGALLLTLSLAAPLAAQDEAGGSARLRIGYFAFDPQKYDTFIDDELVPMGFGWWKAAWMASCVPGYSYIRCFTATPFFDFPSGEHRFAFTPQGKGVDAAILGPKAITFEAGHAYSLAIIGKIDDNSLDLVVIDETQAFTGVDLSTNFTSVTVNGIQGIPAIETGKEAVTVEYGQFITHSYPRGRSTRIDWSTAGDQKTSLFSFGTVPVPAYVSDFGAITGSYPGTRNTDYFLLYNWGYPGPITFVDGGIIQVGDTISGEIAQPGQRVRYTLKLDSSSTLNVYAKATGPRTTFMQFGATMFDSALYIYDAKGMLAFWNDELSVEDDAVGVFDAGLEGVSLKAGDYTIDVGGTPDAVAGPYNLIVETAKSS